jgi:myosin I
LFLGFAYRQVYDKFFYRYRVCCDETWPKWSGDFQAGTDAILRSFGIEGKEVGKGITKSFIMVLLE